MPKKKDTTPPKKVEAIRHDATRLNNPTGEMEGLAEGAVEKETYQQRNADLDPQLMWKGKDKESEQSLAVEAMLIYTQEKIQPQAIIADLRRRTAQRRQEQPGEMENMFGDFNGLPDDASRVEFYQHAKKWSNRMILGDSLQVMTSLARKEAKKEKVQCIFMDPPYGIKFGSNWQTSTKSMDVSDSEQSHEPEMVQAFRDTWKSGIHSYLSYLRDRLAAARYLLTPTGSIFLQIGDENVHRVAALMDEVFGAENRMATITFATTSGSSANTLPQVADYILWYAKNKEHVKYTQLFEELSRKEIVDFFSWHAHVEERDGSVRKLTDEEAIAPEKHIKDARIFQRRPLYSQGESKTGRSEPYTWRNTTYPCARNSQWSISKEGMDRMDKAGRLYASEAQALLMWKRYENEVPGKRINNVWAAQMRSLDKRYVVQTDNKVVQRCILMTTAPGDLVLDPTCGSGTTAVVAEQWGRRWITMDTSRVALTIARARLMSAKYDYYIMQDSAEGAKKESQLSGKPAPKSPYAGDVRHGFVYERVNTISPKHFADNTEIDAIWDRWQEKILPLQKAFNKAIGKSHEEWEIPLVKPEGVTWNAATTQAHKKWLAARKQRQEEMDASVNASADTTLLVNRPHIDSNIVRVTGPFTVESLSPHRILSTDDEAVCPPPPKSPNYQTLTRQQRSESDDRFLQIIHDNLTRSGVQNTLKGQRLQFDSIEPCAEKGYIQFIGYYEESGRQRRAAICVGPEYGSVTRSLMNAAARDAKDMYHMLIVMGFGFDPHANDKLANYGSLRVLRVRLHQDLHMAQHLKESTNSNLFVSLGEPDIDLRPASDGEGMLEVEIRGIDIYNPVTGEVTASNAKDIACWMMDTEYDSESFYARHVYFPGSGRDHYKKLKRALQAEIDKEAWETLNKTTSRPFLRPSTGKVAVKAINHHGDEVLKVFEVEQPPKGKKGR